MIDKRLGVTDYNMYCDTCGLMTNDCPGHFGHTLLPEPVFHIGFLNHVKNILQCICLIRYSNEEYLCAIIFNCSFILKISNKFSFPSSTIFILFVIFVVILLFIVVVLFVVLLELLKEVAYEV